MMLVNLFREPRQCVALLAVCLLFSGPAVCATPNATQKPVNVLFIAIDDLRPELGVYGKEYMKTPAIDQLASEGVTFMNAYSNVPVCGASRASLMSGLRPSKSRFLGVDAKIDKDAPGIPTLPEHFKSAGYTTISLGKIIHGSKDALQSWSETPWHPRNESIRGYDSFRNYLVPENIALDLAEDKQPPPYEAANVTDDAYFDGRIALRAIDYLQSFARQDKPFFLAVGFVKPHLPFNAPKTYWDQYPADSISLTDNPLFPASAPKAARHSWGELRKYAGVPDKHDPVPDDVARQLIHGYYAATSYADAQVGRVLAELTRLGLADNTIVVVWGDHGWSLGEHGLWAKHSTFNVANQIPLIMRVPGYSSAGLAHGPVESVDIYPTLVELASLPLPRHLQGSSLKPMLEDTDAAVNQAVFPRWKNADSIRTDRFYYTEWRNKQGKIMARMLYDHQSDPEESNNVAEQPEYETTVKELSLRLAAHLETLN